MSKEIERNYQRKKQKPSTIFHITNVWVAIYVLIAISSLSLQSIKKQIIYSSNNLIGVSFTRLKSKSLSEISHDKSTVEAQLRWTKFESVGVRMIYMWNTLTLIHVQVIPGSNLKLICAKRRYNLKYMLYMVLLPFQYTFILFDSLVN